MWRHLLKVLQPYTPSCSRLGSYYLYIHLFVHFFGLSMLAQLNLTLQSMRPFLVIMYFGNAWESNMTFLLTNLRGYIKLTQLPKYMISTTQPVRLTLIRLFPLISLVRLTVRKTHYSLHLKISVLVTPILMIKSLRLLKFVVVVLSS